MTPTWYNDATTNWKTMSTQTTTHWADEYRDSQAGTLGYWIYVAASTVRGSEERTRAVAAYAFENNCSIWHAAWALGDQAKPCHCCPCTTSRGEKPVRL